MTERFRPNRVVAQHEMVWLHRHLHVVERWRGGKKLVLTDWRHAREGAAK